MSKGSETLSHRNIASTNSFDGSLRMKSPQSLSRANSSDDLGTPNQSLSRDLPKQTPPPSLNRLLSMSKMKNGGVFSRLTSYMNSTRLMVLLVLCLQNSLFTVLRRYSQGVLKESYSKYEVLLLSELIKIAYSVHVISNALPASTGLASHLKYLVTTSKKMLALALIYGAMNILSFVALRNVSAAMFSVFAQCKILTTATFSTIILRRVYSWTKWRALIALMLGVLLFSEPIWGSSDAKASVDGGNVVIGLGAVLTEISLSGFASIYFEKVIKTDPLQLTIWERNFQLALSSLPVYIMFIVGDGGGTAGFLGGWSMVALFLSALGAGGGLLVALSIKYGDSILKTLATTGSIILSSLLDHYLLGGPLTPVMMIAGGQVIISICNYTFDATVEVPIAPENQLKLEEASVVTSVNNDNDEEEGLLPRRLEKTDG